MQDLIYRFWFTHENRLNKSPVNISTFTVLLIKKTGQWPLNNPFVFYIQVDTQRAEPEKIRVWREEQKERLEKKGTYHFILQIKFNKKWNYFDMDPCILFVIHNFRNKFVFKKNTNYGFVKICNTNNFLAFFISRFWRTLTRKLKVKRKQFFFQFKLIFRGSLIFLIQQMFLCPWTKERN